MPLGGHVGGAGEIKGGPGLVGHAWGAWGCAGGLCCRNRGRGDWGYCHCDRLWGACWRSSSIMQGGELGARHGRLGTLLVLLVLLWLWLGGGKELLCDAGLAARTVIGGAGHGCCGSRRQSLVTLPAAVRVHISAAILFLPTASCWGGLLLRALSLREAPSTLARLCTSGPSAAAAPTAGLCTVADLEEEGRGALSEADRGSGPAGSLQLADRPPPAPALRTGPALGVHTGLALAGLCCPERPQGPHRRARSARAGACGPGLQGCRWPPRIGWAAPCVHPAPLAAAALPWCNSGGCRA
eukprot:1141334-Pelagomonas_calceolata.AAC.11